MLYRGHLYSAPLAYAAVVLATNTPPHPLPLYLCCVGAVFPDVDISFYTHKWHRKGIIHNLALPLVIALFLFHITGGVAPAPPHWLSAMETLNYRLPAFWFFFGWCVHLLGDFIQGGCGFLFLFVGIKGSWYKSPKGLNGSGKAIHQLLLWACLPALSLLILKDPRNWYLYCSCLPLFLWVTHLPGHMLHAEKAFSVFMGIWVGWQVYFYALTNL